MARDLLTVGEAAKAAGLSAKAVRLYEAKGLLPPAHRTDAGYRTYTDDDVAVLRFIRQAKTLDLTLREIRDILEVRRDGTPPCRHVLALLDRHVADIDRTITDLRQLRRALVDTRARAAAAPAGDDHTVCRIIEHV
jgi:MerR family copper efflux transcriptional regulator